MLFGNAGHFVGRVYRDEVQYRNYFRRTGGVGGFLGSILDSKEFELFLGLLLFLIVLNVLNDKTTTAPVTSGTILILIFLHYQKVLLGRNNALLNDENYHAYTFNADRISEDYTQWYRLVTGAFLHESKKTLHLYLNVTALTVLCEVEGRSEMLAWQYALFLLGLTVAAGFCYIALLKNYSGRDRRDRRELHSFMAIGFTGVVFALKAFHNSSRSGSSPMSLPLVGDHFRYSLPIAVPPFAEHFVELFLVSILFQGDVSFWVSLGGILAGHVFWAIGFALSRGEEAVARHGGFAKNVSLEYLQEKSVLIALAVVLLATLYVVDMNRKEKEELLRRIADLGEEKEAKQRTKERRRRSEAEQRMDEMRRRNVAGGSLDGKPPTTGGPVYKTAESPRGGGIPREIPLAPTPPAASAPPLDEDSWSEAAISKTGGGSEIDDIYEEEEEEEEEESRPNDTASVGESLYDDYSVSEYGLPPNFTAALKILTTVTETQGAAIIVETLNTLHLVISNATTKGQADGSESSIKYRRIRVLNPRIQKCNIDGAFDILQSVGFQVFEDFGGEEYLLYPRQESPDWLPAALEAMEMHAQELDPHAKKLGGAAAGARRRRPGSGDKDEDLRRHVRRAALERLHESVSKKKKARESRFTPGLGGGNSETIFYKGGT